jgi:hypothetical protein
VEQRLKKLLISQILRKLKRELKIPDLQRQEKKRKIKIMDYIVSLYGVI